MPIIVSLVVVATLGGTIASYWYDGHTPLTGRLAIGLTTSMVLMAMGGFVAALIWGIDAGAGAAVLLAALPLLSLMRPALRARFGADLRAAAVEIGAAIQHPSLRGSLPLAYLAALFALLWLAFSRVMIERDGAIFTGYVNNLGDLPFHLQVVSSFVYGHNFPVEDPGYAGASFAYPYLADFVTALFVRLGASFREAFFIQNLALCLALVGLLQRLTRLVTRDRLAAAIAPLLVLFSGGLGFVTILDDARRGEHGLLAILGALTHDTTISGEGPYRWGNAITTLLVTQRSMLFGLPVAFVVLCLLWQLLRRPKEADRMGAHRLALAAGIMTGCLPLIHAHSFVVVLGTAFFLGLLFRQWREGRWTSWVIYVVAALALGLPQVLLSTQGSLANVGGFIGIELGWDRRNQNIVWFWFLNTGLFIPLAFLAMLGYTGPGPSRRTLVLFSLAFLPWFLIPNVVRLAPWIWDNNKVLFYWFVGFVPLVSLAVAALLRAAGAFRLVGVAALLVLTLAGGIDVWRVISGQTEYGEFDRDGVAIADQIRAVTAPDALVLHAPTWNVPVYLTGRRSLLGYPGHIWSRGLPYVDREADVKRIYAGGTDAQRLLTGYGVDYVLVSPIERSSLTVNDDFIGRMKMVAQAGEYRLYEVAKP